MSDKLAFVTSVFPNKVKIEVENITAFKENIDEALGDLKIGSYLEISDNDGCKLIAIIESYQIEMKERIIEDDEGDFFKDAYSAYVLEASPLGTIVDGVFTRGGDALTIPPTEVKPASKADIKAIYEDTFKPNEKFLFSRLSQDNNIEVPVNGNKFFNKHFSIVGSSGSGKSHTVAKIIQNATLEKNENYFGLNNSHVVIFDIHNEYLSAFPEANFLNVNNLVIPYWLLNSDELKELFLDTEANDHNQKNVFKEAVITSKRKNLVKDASESDNEFLSRVEKIHYDSPVFFDLNEVLDYSNNKNSEMVVGARSEKQGPLFGKLTNFISRLESYLNDIRLSFLLGNASVHDNLGIHD